MYTFDKKNWHNKCSKFIVNFTPITQPDMKKLRTFLNIASVAILTLLFTACGSSNSGTAKDAISAFIGQNENIIAFGSTDLEGVLSKSDYKNIPKLGKLLSTEFVTLEKVIDFNLPLYYAIEGPMDENGNPEATYAFLTLKDNEKFIAELTTRGFDVNTKDDLSYSEDGDFAIGIKKNIAIVVVQKKDFEVEELMMATFDKAESDLAGGKTDEILAQTGDLVFGMNITSLYNTSNTDLEDLDETKKKSLKELVKDSYVQTVVKFEDGAAIIETKNYFSDALKAKMFFKNDNSAPVLKKLGNGTTRLGFATNIDTKKLQALIDEYSPDVVSDLVGTMGFEAQAALMMTGTDLSKIITGEMGAVMIGDLGENGSMIPDFNVFLGLESNGRSLGEMATDYVSHFDVAKVDKDGLKIYSSAKNVSGKGGIKLPAGCENFGKSGISAFINLDGVNFDDFDLEGEANVIRVVKYITFEYNNDGGRLYIKAKEGKENILKQAMKVMVEELESEINDMVI